MQKKLFLLLRNVSFILYRLLQFIKWVHLPFSFDSKESNTNRNIQTVYFFFKIKKYQNIDVTVSNQTENKL